MIVPGDLFEIALIVPNLEEAIERFHHAFGYTFSPIVEGVLPTRDDAGESLPPLRMAVSREFPNVELMETAPGTDIEPPAGTGLHHLGYYVDDLAGESERLQAMGMPLVRGGFVDDAFPVGWVYHVMADGTLIELVDRQSVPLRQTLIAGEVPDSPMVHRVIPLADGWRPRVDDG
jgi:catechol 2,3-dioxygenase-like lactoylglutathione lyase family enzyme